MPLLLAHIVTISLALGIAFLLVLFPNWVCVGLLLLGALLLDVLIFIQPWKSLDFARMALRTHAPFSTRPAHVPPEIWAIRKSKLLFLNRKVVRLLKRPAGRGAI